MSTHDHRQDAAELLKEAGLAYTAGPAVDHRRVYEFDRAGCPEQRGMLLDDGRHGLMMAVRLELPAGTELRGADPTSIEALALLGALTRSLHSRGLQAQLLTGSRGLEGILVSKHVCGGEERVDLREHLANISDALEGISASLDARGEERVRRILDRAAALHVGVVSDMRVEQAQIVPTFDEAQRDRMMKRG